MPRPTSPANEEVYYCDRDCATATGRYLTELEWGFIAKHLARPPLKKRLILDLGGGSGRFALPLHALGMEVIVEEVNRLPLSRLRQNNPAIPTVMLDPRATSFPFAARLADAVLCIEVPDLTESDWFFSEAERILKKGGLLIFTTHNRWSYKGFYKKSILKEDGKVEWSKVHYKSNYFQVRDRLAEAGFRLIDALGYHWIPVSRSSNHRFIPLFAGFEKNLRLRSMVAFSPWIIMAVEKT